MTREKITANPIELTLLADYHQIHLSDVDHTTDFGLLWNDRSALDMLAVGADAIAIGTMRNMDTTLVIELHPFAPDPDFYRWDRVVECSISVPSRGMRVMGCTDYAPDAPVFDIPWERIVLRVSYGDLDRISEDGLDGDDRYRVQIWPGEMTVITFLKGRPD
jgi:hypothetical protein